MLLISFPARAQERFIQSSHFFVVTADKVSIHVHRKVGVITGLLAASAPQLVAGVGLFSVPEDGFSVPTDLLPVLGQIIMSGVDRFLPTEAEINEVAFGPLMSSQAEDTFYSLSDPDSV